VGQPYEDYRLLDIAELAESVMPGLSSQLDRMKIGE
jgi:hypothetical protein